MLRLMGMCGSCKKTGFISFRLKKDKVLVMEDPDWTFDGKMLVHKACAPSFTEKILRKMEGNNSKKGDKEGKE